MKIDRKFCKLNPW